MRVGAKGRYAVVALVDVVLNSEKGPVSLGEVAQRQQISLSYLEQLFAMLRRAGLVVAARGPGGGYRLQRPSGSISLADVYRAVEDVSGRSDGGRDWAAGLGAGIWVGLERHVLDYLEGKTLADAAAAEPLETPPPMTVPGLSVDSKLA